MRPASLDHRRVRQAAKVPDTDITRHRAVVDAFLAAARDGDSEALFALLDPDIGFKHSCVTTRRQAPIPAVDRRHIALPVAVS